MQLAELKDLLSNHILSDDLRLTVLAAIEAIEEEMEVLSFTNERLSKDKEVTYKFVNKMVLDLEKVNQDLSHSNGQLNRYVHIAAHDLKAPLRTIEGFANLLNKSMGDSADKAELKYLQYIKTSCRTMSEMLTDILEYSSSSGGQLNMETVKVTDLVNECVNLLQHDIRKTNTTVNFALPAININCDPIKIKQVFLNLISNSIKFTAKVRPPIIDVRGFKKKQLIQFSVKDNGIGIPKENQPKIFEQFNRIDASYEGTGMGLAICKATVERHDGTIWLESTPNLGTTFHFTLKQ